MRPTGILKEEHKVIKLYMMADMHIPEREQKFS